MGKTSSGSTLISRRWQMPQRRFASGTTSVSRSWGTPKEVPLTSPNRSLSQPQSETDLGRASPVGEWLGPNPTIPKHVDHRFRHLGQLPRSVHVRVSLRARSGTFEGFPRGIKDDYQIMVAA